MALIQATVMSRSLMRTVPIYVILPVDKLPAPGAPRREDRPYKTLYLLHGMFGSCIDWVSGTRIQRYAEEHDLAVVMPSGDNAFYVDQPAGGNNYGEFVGQELVDLTRRMFPLSRRREDTFIAGLSMGGYGALRNGLKYSDTFGYIASLSGACDLEEMAALAEGGTLLERRSFAEACFGDLTKLLESDKNPKTIVRQLKAAGKPLPRIFMACGDADSLLPSNISMADFLKAQGADVTFITAPGAHEWDFWDKYILETIKWLPTGQASPGISSGNVGI